MIGQGLLTVFSLFVPLFHNSIKSSLVLTTISGGPSEKVGLMAGDRIIEVDNKNIAGTGLKNSDV